MSDKIRAASQVAGMEDFNQQPGGRVMSAQRFYRTQRRIRVAEWGTNTLWLLTDGTLMLEGGNELVYEVKCRSYQKLLDVFVARGYSLPAPR